MKIVLFSHSDSPGGAQKMLELLERGLKESGHQVEMVSKFGHPITSDPDLVISNTQTITKGFSWASALGVPHIWYVHELEEPEFELQGKIVAISETVKQNIKALEVTVIRNGIPVDERPRYSDKPYVLTVGGVCPRKDQITFIRAAAQTMKDIPEAKFECFGGFWDREYWKKAFFVRKKLGMKRYDCPLHGHTDDLEPHYCKAQVFVCSSQREPFGLAILEAMAHGLPVVSTLSGGPEEIVIDGKTGYFVPVGDWETMSGKIGFLLKNPDIAEEMGNNGYEHLRRNFSYQRYINDWRHLLEGFTHLRPLRDQEFHHPPEKYPVLLRPTQISF